MQNSPVNDSSQHSSYQFETVKAKAINFLRSVGKLIYTQYRKKNIKKIAKIKAKNIQKDLGLQYVYSFKDPEEQDIPISQFHDFDPYYCDIVLNRIQAELKSFFSAFYDEILNKIEFEQKINNHIHNQMYLSIYDIKKVEVYYQQELQRYDRKNKELDRKITKKCQVLSPVIGGIQSSQFGNQDEERQLTPKFNDKEIENSREERKEKIFGHSSPVSRKQMKRHNGTEQRVQLLKSQDQTEYAYKMNGSYYHQRQSASKGNRKQLQSSGRFYSRQKESNREYGEERGLAKRSYRRVYSRFKWL